jgi:hypothetical protein
MLRRLVAAITLIALVGPLAPATTSMPHDHDCAPDQTAAAWVSGAGCSAGMGALCSTAGCLTTPVALAARPTANISALTDYAALLPLAQHLTDRLSAGPPTPPPNS